MFLFSLNLSGQDQGMKFFDGNWEKLLKQAEKEKRIIYVDAFTEWCGPCKKMAKDVFTTQEAGKFYNSNFINYKMDMEKGEGLEIAKKYKVKAYPTYLFINSNGELVHRAVGSMKVTDFILLGENALDPAKNLKGHIDKFNAGQRKPEFLLEYAIMLKEAYMDYEIVAKEYFDIQEKELLSNDQNWEAIYALTNSTSSREFQYLVSQKGIFIEKYGEEKVNNKINRVIMSEVYKLFKKKMDVEEILSKVLYPLDLPDQNEMELSIKLLYQQNVLKDWDQYMTLAEEYVENYLMLKESSSEINTIAWNFYKHVENTDYLNKALNWVSQAMDKDDNYYIHDTFAAILFKLEKYGEAENAANEAIELAKQSNKNFAGTEKLLKEIQAKIKE